MKWRRFTLTVGARDVEAAGALLGAATGAQISVEQTFARGDEPDAERRPKHFRIAAYVAGNRASAAQRSLRASLAGARKAHLVGAVRSSARTVSDEDWASGWKRHFKPHEVAPGVYIVPSWERGFAPPRGSRAVLLDPGMAFGTGLHPTTKLALALSLPRVRAGAAAFDIGCGSGILGIAAAQRGAKVYACDVDPVAVRATKDNFKANGLHPAAVMRASGVPKTFGRASLITANITADVLEPLARSFRAALERDGTLVTSGVTRRGRRPLLDALKRAGLRRVDERSSGEWFAFAHERDR
jgi:ribosomal protein L11 methyltransferase